MKTKILCVSALVFAIVPVVNYGAAQKQAAPQALDSQRAFGALRTLNTAEVSCASTYGKGFAARLAALGMTHGQTTPSSEGAMLIGKEFTTGKFGGFNFDYRPGARDKDGRVTAYTVTGRPLKWGRGSPSFFTDQTGAIRWTMENRAPTAKDPTSDSLPDWQPQ